MAKVKAKISCIVLDVLKPHKPSIIELGEEIKELKSVKTIKIRVLDVDEHTEKVNITLNGSDLKADKIREKIEKFGATVHSIDEVIMG